MTSFSVWISFYLVPIKNDDSDSYPPDINNSNNVRFNVIIPADRG